MNGASTSAGRRAYEHEDNPHEAPDGDPEIPGGGSWDAPGAELESADEGEARVGQDETNQSDHRRDVGSQGGPSDDDRGGCADQSADGAGPREERSDGASTRDIARPRADATYFVAAAPVAVGRSRLATTVSENRLLTRPTSAGPATRPMTKV